MRKRDNCKIGKTAIAVIAVLAMVFSVLVGMNAQNTSAEVFGTNVLVSDSGYKLDVAVDSAGKIYVVWEDSGIWCKNSTDGGANFGTAVKISTGGDNPAVAVDAIGNIHVAYRSSTDIYYANFTTQIKISGTAANILYGPQIAAFGGNVYVVWAGDDYNIYLDVSVNGAGFGNDVQVNPTATVVRTSPSIAIGSNGNILVAWCGSSTDHVSFAKATPPEPFTAPVQVDTTGGVYPSVGVDADGKIFVAWLHSSAVYVAVSSDGGAHFGAGVKVNAYTTDTAEEKPSLAVHPCGKVFVAWSDERSTSKREIYFANSTDGGATFGINTKVMDGMPATYPAYPSLTVGNDTEVYIVGRNSTTSSGKIYFSKAPDATWPKAVANLAAVNPTTSSLNLTWTAPGDNFARGKATTYDIRYSNISAITETNWATAASVATLVTLPTPQEGGNTETLTVTGLANDTTYYFALKTADEKSNWCPTISNVASNKTLDDWAPNAVTNLAASDSTSNSIKLTWTAPGDNGNTGTATTYDIRYNTTVVNVTTWADAIQCTGEPTPHVASTPETFVVLGLSPGTKYYFALKTADERPNLSLLSNSANATTLTNQAPNAPTLTAPANNTWTNNSRPTFTWTFSDPDTLVAGDTQGGFVWQADNNSDFSSPEYTNETTSSVSSYVPTTAIADGIWYWRVKTKDNKGEWGLYSEYWIIKIDATAPTGSILISAGAAKTNTTSVTLTLTYPDGLGSGVDKVRYSNDGVWDIETWETAVLTKVWNLTTIDGNKTVYYQIRDIAGLISTYNDTITLDTAATTIVSETTTGATVTASHTGTGTVAATSASSPGDAPSGMVGVGKFVAVTKDPTLTITWVYIKVPYTAADIPAGADEASLKMYYWTGTEWAVCTNTGVDTVNKFVWTNVTHLTIFAPMAEKAAEAAPINWTLYGGIGIVAIVIIIAIALVVTKKKKKPEVPT